MSNFFSCCCLLLVLCIIYCFSHQCLFQHYYEPRARHSNALHWLDARASRKMDAACCNRAFRPVWLELLQNTKASFVYDGQYAFPRMLWMLKRKVQCSRLIVGAVLLLDDIRFLYDYIINASTHLEITRTYALSATTISSNLFWAVLLFLIVR